MASTVPSTYIGRLQTQRRPSWSSSTSELLDPPEPRHPPPEYRHYSFYQNLQSLHSQRTLAGRRSRSNNNSYEEYIQGLDTEYAIDADESDQDDDLPGDLGLSVSTRILDSLITEQQSLSGAETTDHDQEPHQRPFYAIRGRRQPSIASSGAEAEVGIEVASPPPRSSISSVSKSRTEAEPASPGFGSNMKRPLQIDMKNLVGDSVANMSISPGSRDVVLAARRGMYIIDLEMPLEVPRFLPQGGTWDVADVQWNPHPARAEYIVSTSAERLLIWNLLLSEKSNIQHILQAHYRAVTDINWHTTECDTVVSTGIDSWLWAWDLRDPRKPAFGMSAFKSGGTQVKWNRQDGNILASSHANGVYIWDRRKGSLPVIRIPAHKSKIYGIDWSHDQRNEIITCSLDRSIKVWDITESFTSGLYNSSSRPAHINESPFIAGSTAVSGENDSSIYGPVAQYAPKRTVSTLYPVWRARYLPFGHGILSLAQRGETALEMYMLNGPTDNNVPIEVFEGHTDVVKEFVWRKGDHHDFQLITWSKDRTLKFWPIDTDVMQKVGYNTDLARAGQTGTTRVRSISFRNPPEGVDRRLALPHQAQRSIFNTDGHERHIVGSQLGKQATAESGGFLRATTQPMNIELQPGYSTRFRGKPMSRGPVGMAPMDAFTWLASIKVDDRKESSAGAMSGERSRSRYGSSGSARKTRNKSSSAAIASANYEERAAKVKRSESRSRTRESQQDTTGQALQDEITTVLTKLSAYKIKLEKHDLTKKRTCTLGLHGPWGENVRLQVFLRVTFTFPRDYPYAKHPNGIPTVDVERNPLIPMRNRAFMLRRLRSIRERRRPCLEACLRFLLFGGEEEGQPGPALHLNSESSSEEEDSGLPPGERKKLKKEVPAISMLRDHKNLAEPRTSQGTFGPNGELVCFFRASPRIVRNVLRGLTNSSANVVPPDSTPLSPPRQLEELPPVQSFPEPEALGVLRSPSVVSEAVWKLAEAARDRGARSPSAIRRERAEGVAGSIHRVLSNLLAFSQQMKTRDLEGSHQDMSSTGPAAASGSGAVGLGRPASAAPDTGRNYSFSVSDSTIFFVSANDTAGPDRRAAVGYVFVCEEGLGEVCERNARNARACGRYDHERAFRILKTLFLEPKKSKQESGSKGSDAEDDKGNKQMVKPKFASEVLAREVVMQLYTDFSKDKDIQMLGMLSMLILQTFYCAPEAQPFSLSAPTPTYAPSPGSLSSVTPIQNRILQRHIEGSGLFTSTSSILSLPKVGPVDYFSIARVINSTVIPPSSPDWPRLPSVSPPIPPMSMTTGSSRGPWSSLFGASGMRQFVQDTFNKEGHPVQALDTVTARDSGRPRSEGRLARPVSAGEGVRSSVQIQLQQSQQPQQKRVRQKRHSVQMAQPQVHTQQLLQHQQASVLSGVAPLTRSSTEIFAVPLKASLSFSSTSSNGSVGTRRPALVSIEKNIDLGTRIQEKGTKKVVLFEDGENPGAVDLFARERSMQEPLPLFDREVVERFKAHVKLYAEILHRWKMDHQRLELLKAISGNVKSKNETVGYDIGAAKTCSVCLTPTDKSACATCGSHVGMSLCSVCRLPVKGLSRTCLLCYHVTHMSCLKGFNVPICPTGCGCMCEGWYGDPESVGVAPGIAMAPPSASNSGQHPAPSTRASSVVPNDSGPGFVPRSMALHSHHSHLPPLSLLLS